MEGMEKEMIMETDGVERERRGEMMVKDVEGNMRSGEKREDRGEDEERGRRLREWRRWGERRG